MSFSNDMHYGFAVSRTLTPTLSPVRASLIRMHFDLALTVDPHKDYGAVHSSNAFSGKSVPVPKRVVQLRPNR